jgi:hypothetical protein
VPASTTDPRSPHRLARALVVAALVTPAVVAAHLLTRGGLPGATGLAAVAALAGLVTLLVPAQGRFRLAAVVVTAQVAGHTVLALTTPGGTGAGCLPAVGRGAQAGLHLAMLRADAVCTPGTAAAGPALTALLGAVLTGLAVVCGHVALGALAARLVTAGEALAGTVADLVSAVVPVLPARVALAAPAPRATFPRDDARPLVARLEGPAPLRRRGPPVTV